MQRISASSACGIAPTCAWTGRSLAGRVRLGVAQSMRAMTAAGLAGSLAVLLLHAQGQTSSPAETGPIVRRVPGRTTAETHLSDRNGGPAGMDIVDLQRQVNELRSDLLDERERRADRRQQSNLLAALAFGIALGIGGIWTLAKFGQGSVSGGPATQFRAILEQPGQGLRAVPLLVRADTDVGRANDYPSAASVHAVPIAVPLEEAVRRVLAARDPGEAPDPAERPRLLALVAAARGGDPAANRWLASSYLSGPAPSHQAVRDSGSAMAPDSNGWPPVFDRGDDDELERYEEVVADCTAAIRERPDDPRPYLERGDARSKLGRPEEAIGDYDQAISLDPDNAAAYLGRCHAKADLGRHEEALDDFEQAMRLDPDLAGESGDE